MTTLGLVILAAVVIVVWIAGSLALSKWERSTHGKR